MKKIALVLVILFVSVSAFAQVETEMKLNKETQLIEATYYHTNGMISQEGTFNLDKKLHGEWISFNAKGETISVGSYVNGVKTGKWLFWSNDVLKEVEYSNNAIAAVNESKNKDGIVSRN